MTNKPKQWGPRASPVGLGKLKTAIASTPGLSHLGVSGKDFSGKLAGDYQEVRVLGEDEEIPDELFSIGSDTVFGDPLSKAAPITGYGFHKRKFNGGAPVTPGVLLDFKADWVSAPQQETYEDRNGVTRSFFYYAVSGSEALSLKRRSGSTLLEVEKQVEIPMLRQGSNRFLSVSDSLVLGEKDGEYGALYFWWRLTGPADTWGFPTASIRYAALIRTETGGFTEVTGALSVPENPIAPVSAVVVAGISPAPGVAVILVAQYPPDVPSLPDGGEILWEVEHLSSAGSRAIQFVHSGPKFWIFITRDFGRTWEDPIPFLGFDTFTPATTPYAPNAETQPLIGWFPSYLDSDDVITNKPQEWPYFSAERIDWLRASVMVASSPVHQMLFSLILDGRDYPGVGMANWRVVVFRTADCWETWGEVATPLCARASAAPFPQEVETPVDFSPHVVRAGVIVVRCAMGLMSHEPRELRFIRSMDHGETWDEFSPVGLPLASSHQLGYFANARSASGKPVITVTAWDGESYRLYVSFDDCSTWSDRGRIHKPESFSNMDSGKVSPPVQTPINTFGVARYLPDDAARPLDPGCPWRLDGRYAYDGK